MSDNEAQREMTLKEWCKRLPNSHLVNRQLAALEADNAFLDALNSRISDLLHRTANALKGEPVDCLHSFHDLPEVAAKLRKKVKRLEKVLKVIDYSSKVWPIGLDIIVQQAIKRK